MPRSLPPKSSVPPLTGWHGSRRLALAAGAAFVLLWLAPILASFLPLGPWFAEKAAPYINGSIKVGSVSLGWFSPAVLRDVHVRDPAGRTVVTAPRIETQRSLLGLLLTSGDTGIIRVDKAALEIRVREQESNVETALARLVKPGSSARAGSSESVARAPFEIDLDDASVKIIDEISKSQWQLAPLQATIKIFQKPDQPIDAHLQATVSDSSGTGTIEMSFVLRGIPDALTGGEVKGWFQGVPLSLANVLFNRFQSETELSGVLHGQGQFAFELEGGKTKSFALEGEYSGNGCRVTSALLQEPLVLDQFKLPHKARWDGQTLRIERADFTCDLGQASVRGSLDTFRDLLTGADRAGQDVAVDVDLTRLAQRLPKTLKLHEDLRVTSGQLKLHVSSTLKNGEILWEGEAQAANIRGVRATQLIVWPEPLVVEFQARQVSRGVPLIDRLHCKSSFLKIEGSTTAVESKVRAEADLDKLAEPLSRFIDLGTARLAGKASAEVTVHRREPDRFSVDGFARVTDLYVEWLRGRAVEEKLLAVTFVGAGRLGPAGRQQLDAGQLKVTVGTDQLDARLVQSIADLRDPDLGQWLVKVDGELARWQRRASAFSDALDRWTLAGQVHAESQVQPLATGIQLSTVTAWAKELRCTGPGIRIEEAELSLTGAASVDFLAGTVELTQARLACATLTASTPHLRLLTNGMSLHGSALVETDLARVQQCLHDPRGQASEPLTGTIAGRVDLGSTPQGFSAGFDLAVKRFAWGDPAKPFWTETEARLMGQGSYEPGSAAVRVESLRLESQFGSCVLQGMIANLATTVDVELTGRLSYDLEKLEPYLRPYLGSSVRIEGKDTRPFTLGGPLYPPLGKDGALITLNASPEFEFSNLNGEAALSWKSLRALGCDIGPAELRARLQKGWLQIYPLETTLNGGQLKIQPNLRLDGGPGEVVLLQGPLVEKAKLSPAFCAGALGYLAPALANVAEADGIVSLSLEGGRILIGAPHTSEIKGKLTIHQAKVSPGPLVQELSLLLKAPPALNVARECQVPFHFVDGRVHHRDLELVFPELTVRTSGSVGLDGSLALLAEMPIPPSLVGTSKLSGLLAKQTIRVPIGGTVSQPRLDQRALQTLSAQIARDLAGEAVRQGLENRLKGLVRPRDDQ